MKTLRIRVETNAGSLSGAGVAFVMGLSVWSSGVIAGLATLAISLPDAAAISGWLIAAFDGTLIAIVILTTLAVKRGDAMQRRLLRDLPASGE